MYTYICAHARTHARLYNGKLTEEKREKHYKDVTLKKIERKKKKEKKKKKKSE